MVGKNQNACVLVSKDRVKGTSHHQHIDGHQQNQKEEEELHCLYLVFSARTAATGHLHHRDRVWVKNEIDCESDLSLTDKILFVSNKTDKEVSKLC